MSDAGVDATLQREKDSAIAELQALKQEVASSGQLLQTKDLEINELRGQIAIEQAKTTTSQRQKAAIENKVRDIERQIKSETERAVIYQTQIGKLKAENRALQDDEDEDRFVQLTQRVSSLDQEIQTHVDQKAAQKKQIEDLEEQQKATSDLVDQLRKENDSLKAQLQARDQMLTATEEKITALQSQNAAKDGRIDALNGRATLFSNQVGPLKKSLADKDAALTKTEASLKSLQDELASLKAETLDKSNKVVEADAQTSKRDGSIKVLEEKAQKLQQTVQTQTANIAKLEAQLTEAKSKTSTAESQLRTKQTIIDNLTKDKKLLQEEAAQAKDQLTKQQLSPATADPGTLNTSSHAEVAELQTLIAEKDQSNKVLTAELTKLRADVPRLTSEIETLTSRVAELQANFEMSESAEKQLSEQLEDARKEITKLNDQSAHYDQELSDTKVRLEEESARAEMEAKEARDAQTELAEIEKLYSGAAGKIEQLTTQIQLKEQAIAKLNVSMNTIRESSLAENKGRIATVDNRVAAAEISVQGRDKRLTTLTEQLRIEREKAQLQHEEFSQAKEKLATLENVELQARDDEISMLRDQIGRLELSGKEKDSRVLLMQEKFISQREELRMRVEQSRLLFDKLKAREEELRIMRERNGHLEAQITTEQSISAGLDVRLASTTASWESTKAELADLRTIIKNLEVRLEGAQDELQVQVEESDLSKTQMLSSQGTLRSKEQRIDSLHAKYESMRMDLRLKDEKVQSQGAQLQELQAQIADLRKQVEAADGRVNAAVQSEAEINSQLAQKDIDITNLNSEIQVKNDQIQVLNDRVLAAREETQQEIRFLKTKIESTEAELRRVTESVNQTMEQLATGETGAGPLQDKDKLQQEGLGRAEALAESRAEFIKLLQDKLAATKLEISSKEEEFAVAKRELEAKIAALEKEVLEKQDEVAEVSNQLALKTAELQVQLELAADYEQSANTAQSSSVTQENQVAKWRDMFEELQREHAKLVQETKNQKRVPNQDGDTETAIKAMEHELESVRVLYFQVVCLFVKSQLLSSGQLQNVLVKDLYEEVKANNLLIEEWPTFVFSRTYSHA
eukprot:c19068_g1_i3.p1 GENE.c19068_g1_i3~~c19068_g1_i3.p1  ORF type:complete len:1088 (+),score=280.71 c19068_g1_i3:1-3264(+)